MQNWARLLLLSLVRDFLALLSDIPNLSLIYNAASFQVFLLIYISTSTTLHTHPSRSQLTTLLGFPIQVWTLALAKVDPLAPQPPAAKPTGDPPRSTKVQFREDQIIVVFKDGFQPPGLSRWATEKVGNGETVPQAIERMQRNPSKSLSVKPN